MKKKSIFLIGIIFCFNLHRAQFFVTKPSNFGLNTGDLCISFVDIDNDGDMDAYGVATAQFWKNTGNSTTPAFSQNPSNYGLNPPLGTGVDFVDIDQDGDQDAFVVYSGGSAVFWENVGSASTASFLVGPSNFGLSPACSGIDFVDIDEDGDQDAFCVFYGLGTQFWRNTGTLNTPSFSQSSNFGLTTKTYGIDFLDFDNDGDLDAFSNDGVFWQNSGTQFAPSFTAMGSNYGLTGGSGLRFADMDNDGDKDAFVSNSFAATDYYENILTTGLVEKSDAYEVAMYPCPGNGEFNLNVKIPGTMTIKNYMGQLILTSKISEGINSIDLARFPDGIYFITLQQDNRTFIFKYLKST